MFTSGHSKPKRVADKEQLSSVSSLEAHKSAKSQRAARTVVPPAWQKKTGRAGSLVESFFHAFHGIYVGVKQERNIRIHFCSAALAIVLGLYFQLNAVSWLALFGAIGLVITAEFLNTAIEHLVDLAARGQYHMSARYAKDTAAAAVLVAAVVAVATGGVIFVPHILSLLR